MCGIFGWAGKDPKKFNKDKFDKLGIYNIQRGKDSCGISIDGDIVVGVSHFEKLYSDFIISKNNLIPKKYPVVIGHTRQASAGNIVNESNAHPFAFGVNKSKTGYAFIGCHNGTLYNSEELAKKYDIEEYEKKSERTSTGGWTTSSRKKIDSEILLEIIYTHQNFKVLNDYIGAAALMFTNTNEPNKVYIWKGASRLYPYPSNKIEEERPLFYHIENKNSLYISSIKDSLITIGGIDNETVFPFEENMLTIITNGDISTAEKIPVSREKASQKELYTTTTYKSHAYNFNDHGYDFEELNYGSCFNARKNTVNTINKHIVEHVANSKIAVPNIYNESTLKSQNDYGNRVYYKKLRYWAKGHLINGIYVFIKDHGFYKLTETSSALEAITVLKGIVGVPFIGKDFSYSKGINEILEEDLYVPFTKSSKDLFHYFVEGAKIRTYSDFKVMYEAKNLLNKHLFLDHVRLSHVSCYPLCSLNIETKHEDYQGIVYDGELADDIIIPLGAEKIYTIKKGNLKKMHINKYFYQDVKPVEPVIILPENLDKTESNISFKDLKEKNHVKPEEIVLKVAIEETEVDDEEKELEALADEFELISENLNEMHNNIENHIDTLLKFNNDVITEKIDQLKYLRDQLTIILETN